MRNALVLFVLPVLAACGSAGPVTSATGGDPASEPLAPPTVGMQLATTKIALASGAEQYSCWSFSVPKDAAISLAGLDNQVPTTGVHHWAVFTNTAPVKESGPYECATMGVTWGLVSGGGVGTPGVKFPEGTAMTLNAGQHIIFQLHLLNAGAPIEVPPAYINLIGTTGKNLQPVGLLIAGTLNITIPAHATGVPVSGGCALQAPMENIFSAFPHMHQRGRRIATTLQPKAGGAPVVLTDHMWDFHDQGLYPAKGSAVVGDQVTVTCTYDNPGATDVHFGLSTKDEMCIDVLYYYPATQPSTYCGIGG